MQKGFMKTSLRNICKQAGVTTGKAAEHDENSDFESAARIVHELYQYRDEVLLILTRSQGSSMESMPDQFVDLMDEHNVFACEAMCKAYGVPMVDRKVVHWMSHFTDRYVYFYGNTY